jgi:hypothetical protein
MVVYPSRYTIFIPAEETEKTAVEKVKEILKRLDAFEELVLPWGIAVKSAIEPNRIQQLKEEFGVVHVSVHDDKIMLNCGNLNFSELFDLKRQIISEVLGEDPGVRIFEIEISNTHVAVVISTNSDSVNIDFFDKARKAAEKILAAFDKVLSYFYFKDRREYRYIVFVGYTKERTRYV